MPRPQWEQVVAQAPRVALATVDLTDQLHEQSPIPPFGYAIAQWNPPAGYVARPLSWDVLLERPWGALQGMYGVLIRAGQYGSGLTEANDAWIALQASIDQQYFGLVGYRPIPVTGDFDRVPATDEAMLLVMQTMQLYRDESALIVALRNGTDAPWVLDDPDLHRFRVQLRLEQITEATV